MKKCTKCGEVKTVDEFSADKNTKDGKRSYCKRCQAESKRKYLASKGIKPRIKRDVYAGDGKKKCPKCGEVKLLSDFYSNTWAKDGKCTYCKRCEAESKKKYYEENSEKVTESKRRYYEENKERILESKKKWKQANKEKVAENKKKYCEENKEKEYERKKKWKQANKDRCRLSTQLRLARKKSLSDTLTTIEWNNILERFNNSCALTGQTNDVHVEHFIPVAWCNGGGTTVANCYPLSRSLNSSKQDMNPFMWIKKYPEHLERFNELVNYLAEINGMTVQKFEDYVNRCDMEKAEGQGGDDK